MKRRNITVVCEEMDEKAMRRQLRKLGARNIEKKTYHYGEDSRTVEFKADIREKKIDSKKSDRLFKLADSIENTVEA